MKKLSSNIYLLLFLFFSISVNAKNQSLVKLQLIQANTAEFLIPTEKQEQNKHPLERNKTDDSEEKELEEKNKENNFITYDFASTHPNILLLGKQMKIELFQSFLKLSELSQSQGSPIAFYLLFRQLKIPFYSKF